MTAYRATSSRPRLKVCCIASVHEAELAISYGANAIGLVSAMPSGPGVIPDDLIAKIAAQIPPGVSAFLLTSSRDVSFIVDQQRRLGTSTIQLCDLLPSGDVRSLRRSAPGVAIV